MIRTSILSLAFLLTGIHSGFTQDLNSRLATCTDFNSEECQTAGLGLNNAIKSNESSSRGSGLGRGISRRELSIQITKPIILGNCPKTAITMALKKRKSKMMACIKKIAKVDDDSIGQINMKWSITGKGRINKLRIRSATVKNKSLKNCLLNSIKRLRFPRVGSNICMVRQKLIVQHQ